MKREGRQPGIEITYRVLPRMEAGCWGPGKVVKSKPSRVPLGSGPRWSGCHRHPTLRSKDKSKGANKKRSHEDSPWRASYSGGGFSSASVLDRLACQDYYPDHDEDEDVDDNRGDGYHQNYDYGYGYGGGDYSDDAVGVGVGVGVGVLVGCEPHSSAGVDIGDIGGGGDEEEEGEEEEEDDDDDCMSFCDVGFVVDQIEGEDWCLVAEM